MARTPEKVRATFDDANLVLKAYDLRREPRLREARVWFRDSFKAKTLDDWSRLCTPGSEENASFRMVTSYWEMVASFITSGVLNEELFFQSGRELLFVWERIRDIVPAYRTMMKHPNELRNFEVVANRFTEWFKTQGPEAYEAFSKRVRG